MAGFQSFIRSLVALTGLFFVGAVRLALAWPPEIGPELNFTNDEIELAWKAQSDLADTKNPVSLRVQQSFRDEVRLRCPECPIRELTDRYGVLKYRVFPAVPSIPGWYFEITLDVGVIEITSKPIPVDRMLGVSEALEELVYHVAQSLKLRPARAGHLNLGIVSTFGGDAYLFRNFIVDYFNHPSLTRGVTGYYDKANAPHPEELEAFERLRLRKILDTASPSAYDPAREGIEVLARRLYDEVYVSTPVFWDEIGFSPQKYQALNVSSIVEQDKKALNSWPRIELRATAMQKSVRELQLISTLFAARIEFLKRRYGPYYGKPLGLVPYIGHENYHSLSPDAAIADFYRYITEAGLAWNDYKGLVNQKPSYRRALEKFERGGIPEPELPAGLASTPAFRSGSTCPDVFSRLGRLLGRL
jgi:hypothetical protein